MLCMAAAVMPDLDFLPGLILGQPALYHQGISHSIGFAIGVGLSMAWTCCFRGQSFLLVWGLFSLAYCSHLILDLFGPDLRPPYGIPLLWPISNHYYLASVSVFLGVRHADVTSATNTEWLSAILDVHNLTAIAFEVGIVLPLILVVRLIKTRFSRHESINLVP
jgi:inner membrane protein